MSEKVFFHTAHKALWNWLSKHPTRLKNSWPGWSRNGGFVEDSSSDCIACDYAEEVYDIKEKSYVCYYCPICFPHERCLSFNGLFLRWGNSETLEERADIAAQIRDLPVREGVVCK